MPKLSVVVPVYNTAEYIPHCIDSILSQTMSDFELILVNDGSTDSSAEVVDAYKEKDPRIIAIHKENGGLSDARNTGMRIAQGTYIQFIDGDDYIEPTMFEKCIQKLEETQADIVMFDIYQYYMSTGEKEIIKNPFSSQQTYSLEDTPTLLTNTKNCAWNKMYRLSLFQDNGIEYPYGYYYEDLGTTYRLIARAKKIAFLNEPLYDYLQDRPGNITQQFNEKVYHVLDMVKLVMDDYKALGIYEKYYEELKYLGCINILECLKKTRNVLDKEKTEKFVDVCFWFIKQNWPEFPKCKYKINREKNDWIYMNPRLLKLYLAYRRKKRG